MSNKKKVYEFLLLEAGYAENVTVSKRWAMYCNWNSVIRLQCDTYVWWSTAKILIRKEQPHLDFEEFSVKQLSVVLRASFRCCSLCSGPQRASNLLCKSLMIKSGQRTIAGPMFFDTRRKLVAYISPHTVTTLSLSTQPYRQVSLLEQEWNSLSAGSILTVVLLIGTRFVVWRTTGDYVGMAS